MHVVQYVCKPMDIYACGTPQASEKVAMNLCVCIHACMCVNGWACISYKNHYMYMQLHRYTHIMPLVKYKLLYSKICIYTHVHTQTHTHTHTYISTYIHTYPAICMMSAQETRGKRPFMVLITSMAAERPSFCTQCMCMHMCVYVCEKKTLVIYSCIPMVCVYVCKRSCLCYTL
jgi:hypothetical protein